jgi:hypothetical protein
MLKPTLHLNGTSYERLRNPLLDALYALSEATVKLQQTAPHGRDYYVQPLIDGREVIYAVQEEHRERLRKLDAVADELREIIEDLDRQNDERQSRKAGR